MSVQQMSFFHEATSTVTYLVWDEATGEAAVIDPVLDREGHLLVPTIDRA